MNAPQQLVIYHTSDIHGRTGFGPKLAALVERSAVLLDCGDSLRGSATVFRRREPVLADLACAPYAAQAVGNREFHYIYAAFLRRARALPMPLLCSNLLDVKQRRPAPFERELRIERGGVSLRLLALLAPQYRTGSGWERIFGWRFIAPERALADILAQPRAPADVTVVLSHLGLSADRRLAARFQQLGAIIGAHSHDTLPRPEFVAGVPIVQAGPYARHVGRLRFERRGASLALCGYDLIPLMAPGAAAA